jgi:hypothetical protein
MPIRLFHIAKPDAVAPILADGFKDGDDGGVWFSQYLDMFGESGSKLLEIMLDMTAEELAAYPVEVPFGKVPGQEPGPSLTWHKIPANFVNRRRLQIREITSQEEVSKIECGLDSWSLENEP